MSIENQTARALGELLAAGNSLEDLYTALRAAFEDERRKVISAPQARVLRDRWLGRRNGLLTATNENWLKAAPREFKPVVGKLQNQLKRDLEAAIQDLSTAASDPLRTDPPLDESLPGPERVIGATHPVRAALEEVLEIFQPLGYSVAEGPEIETFFYNFEALNFPADHPAVDEMDTLFLEDRVLLRTHTSPSQIRIMQDRDALRCATSCMARSTATTRPMRRTARCSTSSRCSRWTRASP